MTDFCIALDSPSSHDSGMKPKLQLKKEKLVIIIIIRKIKIKNSKKTILIRALSPLAYKCVKISQ